MRVIITGHKDSLNNGTMAVFLGLMAGLRRNDPGVRITLISDLPLTDKGRYGHIPGLHIIARPWRRQGRYLVTTLVTAFVYLFWGTIGHTVERLSFLKVIWPWDRLSLAFREAEVAIDVSGDDLTTAYGLFSQLQVLYELIIAKVHNCQTALLAHSVGPFNGPGERVIAHLVRKNADLITFREIPSQRCWKETLLSNAYKTEEPRRPLADLMFLVKMPSASEKSDKGPVIINVSRYIVESQLPFGKIHPQPHFFKVHMAKWSELLEYIHDLTGRKLVLLPHTCRSGKGDDRYYLKKIHFRCPSELPVRLVSNAITTQEVQLLVSRSSFVLTSRLHLALTSMNCSVPFLALAYSHKYNQLLYRTDDLASPVIEMKNFQGDPFFEEIKDRFRYLWNARLNSKKAIIAHACESRVLAKINVQLLYNVLGPS